MNDARTFPELIRYWREEARLSLSAAGKLAGITKAHLWELEQGRANNPTTQTLVGLARAYGASLPYLAHLAADALEEAAPSQPPAKRGE